MPKRDQAWNLRRHIINEVIKTSTGKDDGPGDGENPEKEDAQRSPSNLEGLGEPVALLRSELELLQGAIGKNAKVYCLWHHRLWAIDRLLGLEQNGGLICVN